MERGKEALASNAVAVIARREELHRRVSKKRGVSRAVSLQPPQLTFVSIG